MILVARAIGDDVMIRQSTPLGIASLRALNARPVIGNGVGIGIGAGAVIMGDVHIAEDAWRKWKSGNVGI